MLAHPNSRARNDWSNPRGSDRELTAIDWRTRIPGDPGRTARLTPRIPRSCSVMARMGPGFEGKSGGSRAPIKSLCRRALRGQLGAPMSDTSKDLVRRHFEEIWNQRKM